ncbi:MAG TPA: hypothetical protein VD908_21165 [Cytophagales bacterium]|nr:hypothetical protein [Cytophagales bacterium]
MYSANSNIVFVFIAFLSLIILTGCDSFLRNKKGIVWNTYMDEIGSFSSLRTADLNNDGVLDIVMGAGGRENNPTDTAVLALDGANGKLLWVVPGVNQMVGSAIFKDINNDQVPDVFIGGRWSELFSINGKNGEIIWRFLPERTHPNPADSGWYNFTTPQFVFDQDLDGIEDLLISNGGDPYAPPNNPNRPAGRLLVMSSKTGKILAQAEVPDKKETYLSVICADIENSGVLSIIFGTGGETIGGNLYRTTLNDLLKGDISQAKVLASYENKGFVAAPVLVDVTLDGIYDIIANAVDGEMLAIDGSNDSLIWKVSIPGTEAYASPAIGYFNGDSIPDFFTNYGIGVYPLIYKSLQFMVDGKTGQIQFRDTIGRFQYTSPIVADLNNDGFDDALLNICHQEMNRIYEDVFTSHLLAIDFHNDNKRIAMGDTLNGINNGTTPWAGDLDMDGKLDILYSNVNFKKIRVTFEKPRGMDIVLYKTNIDIKKPIVWGAYLGSAYNGIFPMTAKRIKNLTQAREF